MLIVQKFGGSSLAGAQRLHRAAQIIINARNEGNDVLAVVSAAGDTTDKMLQNAKALSPQPDSRELDALLACGEQQSAATLALLLNEMGAGAVSLTGWQAGIMAKGPYGKADISRIIPYKIEKALEKGQIVIVSGFQAVSPYGDIKTLGRGGSDTSAVALAAALGAEECRIYTDVKGIYTADPRIIPDAEFLPRVDYRDMLVLSLGGSQVLKAESVRLAMESRLKLRLLSSFESSPGSELCFMKDSERPPFAGVTKCPEVGSVSAAGRAASPEKLYSLLDFLKQREINVSSAGCHENCLSLKVAREQLLKALELSHKFLIK